jgi:gas vesicle protein
MSDESDRPRQGGALDVSDRLTYLLIGGGIGAILALLFAPKSGTELRGDIADVARKGIDKSREEARFVGDKAGEYYGTVREKAGEWAGSAREAASRKSGQFPTGGKYGTTGDLEGDETKEDYPSTDPS